MDTDGSEASTSAGSRKPYALRQRKHPLHVVYSDEDEVDSDDSNKTITTEELRKRETCNTIFDD